MLIQFRLFDPQQKLETVILTLNSRCEREEGHEIRAL